MENRRFDREQKESGVERAEAMRSICQNDKQSMSPGKPNVNKDAGWTGKNDMKKKTTGRGRPRCALTRAQIADAGIAMGLNDISVIGVAARLNISHMTLYTYVSSLEELKTLVAEEIFLRWPLRLPLGASHESLQEYLEAFAVSMWNLAESYHGLAPWLLRDELITPAMLHKINEYQTKFMAAYNLGFKQAQWLFETITHICAALADTLSPPGERKDTAPNKPVNRDYTIGIKALITGALTIREADLL